MTTKINFTGKWAHYCNVDIFVILLLIKNSVKSPKNWLLLKAIFLLSANSCLYLTFFPTLHFNSFDGIFLNRTLLVLNDDVISRNIFRTEYFVKVLNDNVISRNFIIQFLRQFRVLFWTILASIRNIRNTRTIRVSWQKVFYIRASTIPTRIGSPSND